MLITADILYDLLRQSYPLQRYGSGMPDHPLHLPFFYDSRSALQPGNVYIMQTQNLPTAPDADCLYICVGQRPAFIRSSYRGEVFYIEMPGADIPDIFNHTQALFEKLVDWESKLLKLLNEGGDIREMVHVSIPILENRMVVVDYGLRMIAHCTSVESNGKKEIQMVDLYETIPENKTAFFQNIYYSTRELRHPYRYNDREDDCYCINLYAGNSYLGACSLIRDLRDFRESDFALFQVLADYIRRAIAEQSPGSGASFITMKTIFKQLLGCLAVSRKDVETALEEYRGRSKTQDPVFVCLVFKSKNKDQSLPSEYLCSVLEKMTGEFTAVEFENTLALFCRFPSDEANQRLKTLLGDLDPLLQDMNFRVGISELFEDVFLARTFYMQALCALDTGLHKAPDDNVFSFKDYALYYMLEHCCGEFEPHQLMPRGFLELSELGRNASYLETLRCYLDNECNASAAAAAMYLHRSTLSPKLEKIRSYVDLDTPEQRLYLRLCLHLYEAGPKPKEHGAY